MSEFEEMLNGILSDPGQMKKIMSIAGSLMDSEKKQPEQEVEPVSGNVLSGLSNMPLGDIMSTAKKVFGSGVGGRSEKTALLAAMKPWMSDKRRNKLDRAIKMAAAMRVGLVLFKKTEADKE